MCRTRTFFAGPVDTRGQGLSQQGVQVSFWHPGPRKTPIFGGKDTLSLGQNFLKILIISRYFKKFYSQMITRTFVEEIKHIIT